MSVMAAHRAPAPSWRMARTAAEISSSDEAVAMGRAIATLRERQGLSQEELADRMGSARQTISRYEAGRPAVLRTDLQRQIADALHVTVEALMDERDNLLYPEFRRAEPSLSPRFGAAAEALAEPKPRAVVKIQAQPQIRDDGDVHYVESSSASSEDLSWMFGANAGFMRLADDALPEGFGSPRFAGYDRSAWPRAGQGCVIETKGGELLLRVYQRRTPAGLLVRAGAAGDPVTIPFAEVKGVYAIRFYGD